MGGVRWLLLLLGLGACSEYGFGTTPDPATGGPGGDPSDPTDPHPNGPGDGDTADTRSPPPDCDRLAHPTVQWLPWIPDGQLTRHYRATDFDADGEMIGTSSSGQEQDVVRYGALGGVQEVSPDIASPQWIERRPRTLADGRIAIGASGTVDIYDPQEGTLDRRVSFQGYPGPRTFASVEAASDGMFFVIGMRADGGWGISRADPSTGQTEQVADWKDHPNGWGFGLHHELALSTAEDWLYVLAGVGSQHHLLAFPNHRGTLGEPVMRLLDADIPDVDDEMQLAVDACGHLYLFADGTLWGVAADSDQAEPLVHLPDVVYAPELFWGHDAGYADPQSLYVTGFSDGIRPVRYAVHLGVSGNHVLSR